MTYRNKGSLKPEYTPVDSDTLLCYRFQETSAPFTNLGTQPSANMTAESGEGTGWLGGQPDGAFGKGLKFSMVNTATGGIRVPHFAYPTSAITASVWVTPTRLVGSSSIGRIFFKAYFPGSWSPPYIGIEIAYANSVSGLALTVNATPSAVQLVLNQDIRGVAQWKKHHVGFTFGDGFLRVYHNGYLAHSVANSNTLDLGTGPWCIGRTINSLNEHAGFILHEARVDKVVRPASWWLENWKNGSPE